VQFQDCYRQSFDIRIRLVFSLACCCVTNSATPARAPGTAAHEPFLATVRFAHPAQNLAFVEYRTAVSDAQERVERVTAPCANRWRSGACSPAAGRQGAYGLRGINLIAAVTLIAEFGDLRRFAHPSRSDRGDLGVLLPGSYRPRAEVRNESQSRPPRETPRAS
jgi:transposase